MRHRSFDDRHLVRLEPGEPVIGTLTTWLVGMQQESKVLFANVSAAGAVSSARIAWWDPVARRYRDRDVEEQLEVVSFQGNVSVKDGAPFLHLHVVLGRADHSVVGGHLQEAVTHPTLEVWLRSEEVPVHRRPDPDTSLDLLDL